MTACQYEVLIFEGADHDKEHHLVLTGRHAEARCEVSYLCVGRGFSGITETRCWVHWWLSAGVAAYVTAQQLLY